METNANAPGSSHPGRIGLTHIHGDIGRLIAFGQWLNGDGFSTWEHAFLDLGDGTLIQAEPGGAQVRPLSMYSPLEVYWCDNIYATVSQEQRQGIAESASSLRGVPYSFLDYEALFTHRLHIPMPGLQDYIASTHHMICSQLVDYAYSMGGVHLFENRWPGYVTPGDLWQLDMRQSLPLDLVICGICGLRGYCIQCSRQRRNYEALRSGGVQPAVPHGGHG